MSEEPTLSQRIRDWDEAVEDDDSSDQMESMSKPFEAGIMLAVADVLERWETGDLAEAMRRLSETAEAVIA
jgi:hypothetical protein